MVSVNIFVETFFIGFFYFYFEILKEQRVFEIYIFLTL